MNKLNIVTFLLLNIVSLCCSWTTLSEEANNTQNIVLFKQNKIELGGIKVIPFWYTETMNQKKAMFLNVTLPDSVPIKDFNTGLMVMEKVMSDTVPVAINGKPIFGNESNYFFNENDKKYTLPAFGTTNTSLQEYLFSELNTSFNLLEDGVYSFNIKRLVISDKGEVSYYEFNSITTAMGTYEEKPIINEAIKQEINTKIIETLAKVTNGKPALKNGESINVRLNLNNYFIAVKNHRAKLVEQTGC